MIRPLKEHGAFRPRALLIFPATAFSVSSGRPAADGCAFWPFGAGASLVALLLH
jgi:hypothetical protein